MPRDLIIRANSVKASEEYTKRVLHDPEFGERFLKLKTWQRVLLKCEFDALFYLSHFNSG